MENKEYTLRSLKASDLFMMTKIINKIGIKEVKDCFNSPDVKKAISGGETEDVAAVGMQVMLELATVVVSNLVECEMEVYQFLASLSGMNPGEVKELPMNTFVDMILDVFRKEEFNDFFHRVVGLPK